MVMQDKVKEAAEAIPAKWWPWIFIGLGLFGGGGGHAGVELLENIFTDTPPELTETIQELSSSMSSLESAVRGLDANQVSTTELLTRTRCEVRADREGSDWRDCWVDGAF